VPEIRSRKNDVEDRPVGDQVTRFVAHFPYRENASNIEREHVDARKKRAEDKRLKKERREEEKRAREVDTVKRPYIPDRFEAPTTLPTFTLKESLNQNRGGITDIMADFEDLQMDNYD
jgi:hypothetical protein